MSSHALVTLLPTDLRRLLRQGVLTAAIVLPFVPQTGSAQTPAPPAPAVTAPAPPASVLDASAEEKRRAFRTVLAKYPPGLGRVLKTDPTLLQNTAYLAQYPALAQFLAAHGEVIHNPSYYFEHVYLPGEPQPSDPLSRAMSVWDDVFEGLAALTVMSLVGGVLIWLVGRLLDYRRWLRMARTQTEVHNKILDRFAGTGELTAYIQSEAGRRFLEAAPITPDSPRGVAAPLGRILWSLQAGIVLGFAGIGLRWMGQQVTPAEAAQGFSMLGVLGISVGLGFVISAAAAYVLSRRLGLLEPAAPLGRSDSPA